MSWFTLNFSSETHSPLCLHKLGKFSVEYLGVPQQVLLVDDFAILLRFINIPEVDLGHKLYFQVLFDGAELPDAECLIVVIELSVGFGVRSAALIDVDVLCVLTLAEDEELQERFAVLLRLVDQRSLVNHVPVHSPVECRVLLHSERFNRCVPLLPLVDIEDCRDKLIPIACFARE